MDEALNEDEVLGMLKINSPKIYFEPLSESHFTLICHWFNKLHVQAFYSLRAWTPEEVRQKLTPYLQHEKGIKGFVIYAGKHPIGYIQSYPIKDHPWENQELSEETIQEAAGFDLFIGDEKYLGKGLGSQIVDGFLKSHIWINYRYCLTDPDIRNEASIRLFQKCGFHEHKKIHCKNALNQSVTLLLYIKKKC